MAQTRRNKQKVLEAFLTPAQAKQFKAADKEIRELEKLQKLRGKHGLTAQETERLNDALIVQEKLADHIAKEL